LTIANKGVKAWQEQNYIRLFMTSNSSNMLNVTSDNRRFWIIKTGSNFDNSNRDSIYKPLFANLSNRNFLDSIYSYFTDLEITIQIDQFPSNKNLELLKENNINPLYKYMHELICEEQYTEINHYKSYNNIFINVTELINNYENWIIDNLGKSYYDKFSKKSFKLLLGEINIFSKVKKINDKTVRVYQINVEEFNKLILTKYKPEEIEEFPIDIVEVKVEQDDYMLDD